MPLGHVIRHHNTLYHLFANDTQLHKSSSPEHFAKLLLDIQSFAESARDWMALNRLRMNDDKTEIMPVGTKATRILSHKPLLWLSGSTIPFSYKIRNLGVYLDSHLSMDQHVNLLCRSVFLELHRIGHLRRHLTVDAMKKLVSSFLLSRLDYCNSLLAGLPENRLDRLQRVQNNAACLVLGRQGQDHAKPLLRSLHWLPVWLSTRFLPSAIIAEIHLLLLTSLIFSLSINLLQMLVSWLFHASNSTIMESVFSYTQDLWPGIPSPNLCVMPQVSPPSDPIWKHSSSKSICTDDFQTHKGVEQNWQFPVYLYILCSVCTWMIVLIFCFIFTALLSYLTNLQRLGCY